MHLLLVLFLLAGLSIQACTLQNCMVCYLQASEERCSQCQAGYYISDISKICSSCKSSCKECTSFDICTTCNKGFFMSASKITCKGCMLNCIECTSENTCVTCDTEYELVDGGVSCGGIKQDENKSEKSAGPNILFIVIYVIVGIGAVICCVLFYFYWRRKLTEESASRKMFENDMEKKEQEEEEMKRQTAILKQELSSTNHIRVAPLSFNRDFQKSKLKKSSIISSSNCEPFKFDKEWKLSNHEGFQKTK